MKFEILLKHGGGKIYDIGVTLLQHFTSVDATKHAVGVRLGAAQSKVATCVHVNQGKFVDIRLDAVDRDFT